MRAIGIRVEPQQIFYTIIFEDGTHNIESLVIPKSLDTDKPRQLSFLRTTLYSVICEYDVKLAGLRTAEGSARTANTFRINIEGVIQELFSGSTIEHYFTGTITSMASRLKKDSTKIKKCIKDGNNLFNVEGWESLTRNKRESFLAALAVLSEKEGEK
ncbi:hypothetical protein [Oceanobacillus kapialis]|uniref:DUF3010 family protein n=1 Tax=Oceanobacillus kapialis TaxID=481353 RepID=A0ABW5PZP0_9BACI